MGCCTRKMSISSLIAFTCTGNGETCKVTLELYYSVRSTMNLLLLKHFRKKKFEDTNWSPRRDWNSKRASNLKFGRNETCVKNIGLDILSIKTIKIFLKYLSEHLQKKLKTWILRKGKIFGGDQGKLTLSLDFVFREIFREISSH